jgi:hypothetical protein
MANATLDFGTLNFGTIAADESHTLESFSRNTGLKKTALRMARQNGLIVRRVHGRAFVLGQDWLDYLSRQAGDTQAEA